MSTLLHIDSSPRGNRSITRQLSHKFAETWKSTHPGSAVIYRDLGHAGLPFVTEDWVAASFSREALTPEQTKAVATSDELIAELKKADQYVFGIPMYNFSVPAVFKAYIDQIVRVGHTVNFTATGFEGLLTGKKVTIITSSGSVFRAGTPYAPYDFQTPYLRTVLGFIGVTDVEFIVADGVNDVNFGKLDRETYLKPIEAQVLQAAAA